MVSVRQVSFRRRVLFRPFCDLLPGAVLGCVPWCSAGLLCGVGCVWVSGLVWWGFWSCLCALTLGRVVMTECHENTETQNCGVLCFCGRLGLELRHGNTEVCILFRGML